MVGGSHSRAVIVWPQQDEGEKAPPCDPTGYSDDKLMAFLYLIHSALDNESIRLLSGSKDIELGKRRRT